MMETNTSAQIKKMFAKKWIAMVIILTVIINLVTILSNQGRIQLSNIQTAGLITAIIVAMFTVRVIKLWSQINVICDSTQQLGFTLKPLWLMEYFDFIKNYQRSTELIYGLFEKKNLSIFHSFMPYPSTGDKSGRTIYTFIAINKSFLGKPNSILVLSRFNSLGNKIAKYAGKLVDVDLDNEKYKINDKYLLLNYSSPSDVYQKFKTNLINHQMPKIDQLFNNPNLDAIIFEDNAIIVRALGLQTDLQFLSEITNFLSHFSSDFSSSDSNL